MKILSPSTVFRRERPIPPLCPATCSPKVQSPSRLSSSSTGNFLTTGTTAGPAVGVVLLPEDKKNAKGDVINEIVEEGGAGEGVDAGEIGVAEEIDVAETFGEIPDEILCDIS